MPLRPFLLDLRELPLCERSIRFLLSLEKMASGDTLLVVNDLDPEPLLQEVKPVLEKGFIYWIPEAGPEAWRILISCEESIPDDDQVEMLQTLTGANEDDSLKRYIKDVRSLWGDRKDPELPSKVKKLLEKLLTSTNPQERWIVKLIKEGLPARELYRDKEYEFIQVGHVHERGHKNPPHDHGPCWMLCGVYHGVAEITTYKRTDDSKIPGLATLEMKESHRLKPGVVMSYLPGEILSTLTVEPSVVFRFLSSDLNKVKRCWYLWDGSSFRPVTT